MNKKLIYIVREENIGLSKKAKETKLKVKKELRVTRRIT